MQNGQFGLKIKNAKNNDEKGKLFLFFFDSFMKIKIVRICKWSRFHAARAAPNFFPHVQNS